MSGYELSRGQGRCVMLLKRGLWNRCFPVNILKLFNSPILQLFLERWQVRDKDLQIISIFVKN